MTNFKIVSQGLISREFLKLGILDFHSAALLVQKLEYKRNADKNDVLCVLKDKAGTCSTKHALLKRLAMENNIQEIRLMLGIFKMNAVNTPKISSVLERNGIMEMPEAHNYLKFRNEVLDFTRKNSKPEDFLNDLLEETEMEPEKISHFKENYHKNFLINYLKQNPQIPYNVNEFWSIREECITALQK